MPFGIPGSEPGGGGDFLGRINCDVRTGFWTITRRIQGADGLWTNDQSRPFENPTFLVDFASLEVGFMKITSPPVFLLVPFGQPVPPQPQEMTDARPGEKPKRAFSPGFRVKVMSRKTFGDDEPYYFSGNSKTLMTAVEALYWVFVASPEAVAGKVPVVKVAGSDKVAVKTPQGTNNFFAPKFEIAGWHERPATLGERLVPPPLPMADIQRPAPRPAAAPVPPPVTKAKPAPVPVADDDEAPF